MELDGYCEKLGIAFEYQGPQHTRFDPRYDRDYRKYYERVLSDERKIRMCRDHCDLIIVDYIVPRHLVKLYVSSRLSDICSLSPQRCVGPLAAFRERPANYMIPISHEPYRNPVWEREIDEARKK